MIKGKAIDAAMDALGAKLRAEMAEANTARIEVRATVGDIAVAMDSAAAIYGFALDHMKIDHAGIDNVTALRALYKVASLTKPAAAPVVALDSAGAAAKFAGLARFTTA